MDAEVGRNQVHDQTKDIELKLLMDAILRKYHYDFRGYSMASLTRRMNLAMGRFGCSSLSQLQDMVLNEPDAFPELISYLTVQVSELFRDPAYFQAVRELVIPHLRTYPSLKVWVAGCSAGANKKANPTSSRHCAIRSGVKFTFTPSASRISALPQ